MSMEGVAAFSVGYREEEHGQGVGGMEDVLLMFLFY